MRKTIKSKLRYWWNTIQFPIATHDDISTGQRWSQRQERSAALLLLLACAVVMLPNISYPLIEPDETRYAQIALEMNESGDWITPMLGGEPYLDKPPLMYWLTAACFTCFGNHETAARITSVLAALGTILLTFMLGRRLVGSRGAWCGAITLLLCGGFVIAGRFLILDSLLAFFVTACLLSGYMAIRERDHRWAWWMASGVACALGALTKGPVALVLCAPPLIANGWLRRDQTRTRLLHWVAFVVPMIVVCVPWYIAVWRANPEFGDYFFWEHNFKRFTQGSNHQSPFWFYLPVIFAGMFPASLLLPSLGVFLIGRAEGKRHVRSKDLGFLFCASVWILLFFSLSSCKLPTYILPAIPLICLMLGGMLDQTVFRPERPSGITSYLKPFPQRATMILLATCLLVMSADVWFCGAAGVTTIVAGVCCLAVCAITVLAWNREVAFSSRGWAFTTLVAVGVLSFTSGRFVPTAAHARSVHAKAAELSQQQPGTMVVYFLKQPHGVKLKLPSDDVIYFPSESQDEFVAFVARHRRLIVVTADEHIEETRQAVSQTHELVSADEYRHLYLARPIEQPVKQTASRTDQKIR